MPTQKAPQHQFTLAFGNAVARVLDHQGAALCIAAPADIDAAALRNVLDGVVQQVAHQHLQGLCVARHGKGLRSEEHTSELQSQSNLVCRLLLEKKKKKKKKRNIVAKITHGQNHSVVYITDNIQ